jgi:hypothetical protein
MKSTVERMAPDSSTGAIKLVPQRGNDRYRGNVQRHVEVVPASLARPWVL